MKKVLIAILTCIIALGAIFCVGCKDASFKEPTLTNAGELKGSYGFVAETDNYLYFINGVAESSETNTFGTPVKGSLMAVEKSTIGTDNLVQEVVVPKLFITEDYTAGLLFNGDYVYFTTPSTDKNASGNIAFDDMTFMRATLDGKKSEELFTLDTFDIYYNFYVDNGNVKIVYYDKVDTKLVCYDVNSKKSTTIVVSDDKIDEKDSLTEEYTSLDTATIIFAKEGVYFTKTVYSYSYSEEQASSASYSRATATYNHLYRFNPNGNVELIKRNDDKTTYALSYLVNDYVFFTETDIYGNEKNYALKGGEFTLIDNADNLSDSMVLVSLNEVYFIDSTNSKVVKSTLIGSEVECRQNLMASTDITSLLFVNDNEIYFYGSDSKIYKHELSDATSKKILVTENTADLTWYDPIVLSVNGVEYLFYIDDSVVGSSYIKYININAEVIATDEDDDGEDDTFTLGESKLLGKMTDEDIANEINNAISNIGSVLTLESDEETGNLIDENVVEARKIYNAITSANENVKDYVSSNDLTKLENAEKAVELANIYKKLKANFADMDTTDKSEYKANETYKSALKEANEYRQKLFDIDDEGATYEAVRNMIPDRYNYYYQQASKIIED